MKRSVYAIAAVIGFNGALNTACSDPATSSHARTAPETAVAETDSLHQPEKIEIRADVQTPNPVVTDTATLSGTGNGNLQTIKLAVAEKPKPIKTAQAEKPHAAAPQIDIKAKKPEPQVKEVHAQEVQVQEVQVQEVQVQEIQVQEVQVQEVQAQEVQFHEVQAQEVKEKDPATQTQKSHGIESQPLKPNVDQAVQLQTAPVKHLIEIKKFKFSRPKLEVNIGDEVTWINLDIVPHTATALDESWDSGELKKGESYTMLITDNMSLAYFCLYHRQMKAEFVMKDKT